MWSRGILGPADNTQRFDHVFISERDNDDDQSFLMIVT